MSDFSRSASTRPALCRECDRVMHLPARAPGEAAHCPRCHHHVAGPAQRDMQRPMAWALASLVLLGLVFAFDFLSFSTRGVGHTMSFVDAAGAMLGYDYPSLAAILLATTVLLPGAYLAALLYIAAAAQSGARVPGALVLARMLRPMEPWMMADVFIVGVLVSLIKVVSLAEIEIGASFVAFCGYALCLLRTLMLIDWVTLWDALAPVPPLAPEVRAGHGGRRQGLVVCAGCDAPFHDNARHRCPRCGRRHLSHGADRLQLTWALIVTAAILYIPANVYPIMAVTTLGSTDPQTIVGGVISLAAHGSWPIALVIFVASIVVPISKIAALAWLCRIAGRGGHADSRSQMRLYRLTEKIGRWSMIDVFVVAVLGALVQAGALMAIRPGAAALAFAAVVVVTMIAALTFDTRALWRDAPIGDR